MGSSPSVVTPSKILSLAANQYNCYPSELVTFYLRFEIPQETGSVLQFSFPSVMQVESYQMPEGIPSTILSLNEVNRESILHFPLQEPFESGKCYEMSVSVRVKTFRMDHFLLNEARIYDKDTNLMAYEAVQIAVASQGKYMQHLPEIYESDDLTNRFLMLIESFWKPINQQIEQMSCIFDPFLTPQSVLPWLSSWVGMPFESSLPVDRMRSLLHSSMLFYQQRGTFQALKTYLETFTGGEATISERRAKNFILGGQCKLGVEVALGSNNQPNSVQVGLKIPAEELDRVKFSAEMYQQKMDEIVRSLIPAHTAYRVQCEFAEIENTVNMKGN